VWKAILLSKIRAHRVAALLLVVLMILSSTLLIYAFTAFGGLLGTCPLLRWGSTPTGKGPMPFSIVAVGSSNLRNNPYAGTGPVVWCLYNNSGALKESYQTNKILGAVEASSDGSSVVATGFLILPGPAGIWANGTLYLFDSQGRILWNFSTPDDEPIFSATLSHNGSVILASGPGLFYLNHQGKILWSGSGLGYGSIVAAQLVNDGLEVVAGLSNYGTGSAIVMYDDQGKILWKYSINDSSTFDSTRSLAVSNSHIAAGTTVSGYNGTLHYMDFSGNQVWSRHINSAILGVDFIENGLEISVQTNWGIQTFDLTGNRIT